MPFDGLCALFHGIQMPGSGEQWEYYKEISVVLTWKFLENTTPFTLQDIFCQSKPIMDALIGSGRDESHLEARMAEKLGDSRASFAGKLRQLAGTVIAPHHLPAVEDVGILDFTTQFQRLMSEPVAVDVLELNNRLLGGFRNAFESLVMWTQLVAMNNTSKRQLLVNLITNYIPHAYRHSAHGSIISAGRLEMFKDMLAVITGATIITDEDVAQLYMESSVRLQFED